MTWATRAGRLLTALGWVALLVGIMGALGVIGRGPLSTPPLTSGLGALRSWASTRDAATILMTGVRLGGRLLAGYLLASTVLAMLARATRRAAAVRIADAITLPPIRRLATGTVGLLVVAGPIGVAGPAPGRNGPTAALVAGVAEPAAGRNGPTAALIGGVAEPAPVLVAGASTAPTPSPTSTGPVDTGAWPALGLLPSTAAEAGPTTWTVRPGDSLWVIAKSVLHSAWGRAPTDEETGRFWVVVVALNRPRLEDPANANLLFPGQQMAVPPPPSPPYP
jgi:hypothetical protein